MTASAYRLESGGVLSKQIHSFGMKNGKKEKMGRTTPNISLTVNTRTNLLA